MTPCPLYTAPPWSIHSVPLPLEPIWNELTVAIFHTDPVPDTVTLPTLPAATPMVPHPLCAMAPPSTSSVPLLPDATPIDTSSTVVQVDAAPAPSWPDTVRVPTAPLSLPI